MSEKGGTTEWFHRLKKNIGKCYPSASVSPFLERERALVARQVAVYNRK